jgi:hypothetical protein
MINAYPHPVSSDQVMSVTGEVAAGDGCTAEAGYEVIA